MNYPKINSLFFREETKPRNLMWGMWSCPEFELLQDHAWDAFEKLDGTNICISIDDPTDGPPTWRIRGRTDAAQIPTGVIEYVNARMLKYGDAMEKLRGMDLFGEGIGAKIQEPVGKHYGATQRVVLFDVRKDNIWCRHEVVADIANDLRFEVAPYFGKYTIEEAVSLVYAGFPSRLAGANVPEAEGLILHAPLNMKNRQGSRIITKVKRSDFRACMKA
jgi:hypothetical protein